MCAVIIAGQALQFWTYPHVVLFIRLVHGVQRPRHPADTGFDGGEFDFRESFQNARSAEIGHRLHGGGEGMHGVIDHRAAITRRGARVASGRDMEGDR